MNFHKFSLLAIVVSLLFVAGSVAFAQQEEMTEEEAGQKIEQLEKRVTELKRQSTTLDSQLDEKNNLLRTKQSDYENCINELYALVGATRSDVDAYEQRLRRLENKVSDLLRLSPMDLLARKSEVDEAENEYKELAGSKISLLPMFYDRVRKVGENIQTLRDNLNKAEKTYTVGTWAHDKDCLWNIAKKPDIYGDAFKWPKIWQKNKEQIKNPDLIYPGQVLRIPAPAPLTTDEESAARRYYRQKREAEAAGTMQTNTSEQPINK
jgi:outer membrane murein-binding lipoprotein Lpp